MHTYIAGTASHKYRFLHFSGQNTFLPIDQSTSKATQQAALQKLISTQGRPNSFSIPLSTLCKRGINAQNHVIGQ